MTALPTGASSPWILLLFFCQAGCEAPDGKKPVPIDVELSALLDAQGVEPIQAPRPSPRGLVELGQSLFFDPILSGNRDVACATCHLVGFGTVDGLPLTVGTGATGDGPERRPGPEADWGPRNTPGLFHLGDPAFTRMFWDGRVERHPHLEGIFASPAEAELPLGMDSLAAVQALFPPTSPLEMRGHPGDVAADGQPNEIAAMSEGEGEGEGEENGPKALWLTWDPLMDRILSVDAYYEAFRAEFRDVPEPMLTFGHAARAIAAFEFEAFALLDSPWDEYLRGRKSALSAEAKRGAHLFYGAAGCSGCHSGRLMSDMQFHALGVPQVGPGKEPDAPRDTGRGAVTGQYEDRYRFRTPPLRNVAVTGPWFHDGSVSTLEDVIRHHLEPVDGLENYNLGHLPEPLWGRVMAEPGGWQELLDVARSHEAKLGELADAEIGDLISFLHALTDPAVFELHRLRPSSVPSGLPVPTGPTLHRLDHLPPELQ